MSPSLSRAPQTGQQSARANQRHSFYSIQKLILMPHFVIMRRPSGVQMSRNVSCWEVQADNMFSGPITMSPNITRCQHQGWMRVTGEYIICFVQDCNLLYIINLFACMNKFVCHMFTVVVLFEYSELIMSTEAVSVSKIYIYFRYIYFKGYIDFFQLYICFKCTYTVSYSLYNKSY